MKCILLVTAAVLAVTVVQSVAEPANCLIKGNISINGERIYHMPGQRYYNKTQIDKLQGERWFCTKQEAITAGWRKAKV